MATLDVIATTAARDRNDVDSLIEKFARQYETTGRPIRVNFRKLAPDLRSPDRLTHLIHPYPAKLLVHIPYFFLSSQVLSKPRDTVLDPFCGSGTVLLEALAARRVALGADSNPLARLISQVKTRPIDARRLRLVLRRLIQRFSMFRASSRCLVPDVIHLDYWFYPHVVRQLAAMRLAVDEIRDADERSFFLVVLSRCVRRVSLADPRLSVPVRLRGDQYPKDHWLHAKTLSRLKWLKRVDVYREFEVAAHENIQRMEALLASVGGDTMSTVVGPDARDLTDLLPPRPAGNGRVPDASVQLIITSPPYAGAQKYIRAASLSLGWLGLCESEGLATLERASIGREHYRRADYDKPVVTEVLQADKRLGVIRRISPLRAHILEQYLVEMRSALIESSRVLKSGGYLVLVTAPNRVCGRLFPTDSYLHSVAEESGFTRVFSLLDRIRSRSLMTKRNGTAGVIPSETVSVFRRAARSV